MKQAQVIILALLSIPCLAYGQAERYELGRRLRAFEAAWEEQTNAAARKKAVGLVNPATGFFLSGRIGEAGAALDQARFALLGLDEPTPAQRLAQSLSIVPTLRLLDASTNGLPVQVKRFYGKGEDVPPNVKLRLSLRRADGQELAAQESDLARLPQEISLSLKDPVEGDHRFGAEVLVDGKSLVVQAATVSLVRDLPVRLEALKKGLAAQTGTAASIEKATLEAHVTLLDNLAAGKVHETDFPAMRLLATGEALAKSSLDQQRYFSAERTGEHWLSIPVGDKVTALRLYVPEGLAKPVPLVIALHGAGGSENLFFEGYGQGAVVKLATARGWMVVAPRSVGFGAASLPALVDELAQRYPIDKKRVLVVGHSMGAAQAVGAASQSPDRFAAVAALGGGGAVRGSEPLRKVPFFIGVGTMDFALPAARRLREALTKANVNAIDGKEYQDVEHLLIVQVALPDVFRFFDGVLADMTGR